MKRCDVIVLGGGIIGASIAEELARRGSRTCLIERGPIGGEASKAAAGILSAQMDVERPGAFLDFCQTARRLYPAWTRHLERASKIPVGFHVDGILYVAHTPQQARRMDARMRWQRRHGLAAERLSRAAVTRLEPSVTGRCEAGFLFPGESQVDNVKLMDALAVACRKAGVELHEQVEARKLRIRGNRVAGVATDRFSCAASVVVNCLGSWATLDGLPGPKLPVAPAKGQMLGFEAPRGLLRRPVMSDDAYGVQRRNGRLIVGSTVEFIGFDKRLTLAGMRTILSGFGNLVDPRLFERCRFQDAWVGLRPCSRDRMPVIGATAVDGLYAATGHFRHGILLAPVTAQVIADLILAGHSAIDLAPFSPQRFGRSR